MRDHLHIIFYVVETILFIIFYLAIDAGKKYERYYHRADRMYKLATFIGATIIGVLILFLEFKKALQ